MKAYERLNVEVVKFEAQDVITASVAAPTECICPRENGRCSSSNHYGPDGEPCSGEITGYYPNGNPKINHNCEVN